MATPAAADPATGLPPVTQPDPQLAAMRQELSRLTGKVDRIVQAPPARAPEPTPGQQMTKKEMEAKFYADPLQNVANIAGHVAQQVAQSMRVQDGSANFDTLVEMARSQAKQLNPTLWDRFDQEISNLVVQSTQDNILMRQNVNVWRNAFNQIKGWHADELIAEATTKAAENKSAALHLGGDQGGPASPSSRPAPGSPGEKLTLEEAMVAKGLRLTPEQYLDGRRRYNSQDHNPANKSSWDEAITFDTREQRRKQRERAAKAAAK